MDSLGFTGGIEFLKEDISYTILKKGAIVGSIIETSPERFKMSIFVDNETLVLNTICITRAVNLALQFLRYESKT
jgi:hypothetical protein